MFEDGCVGLSCGGMFWQGRRCCTKKWALSSFVLQQTALMQFTDATQQPEVQDDNVHHAETHVSHVIIEIDERLKD